MLIKVTNYCSLGCSHCMEDSTVKGEHMTVETFERALEFTRRIESRVWEMGAPPLVHLSGGECTEHPDILHFIHLVEEAGFIPSLITNGMWLENPALRDEILVPERFLFVQVTNDARFYPKKPAMVEDRRITYVDQLSRLLPLGRITRKKERPEDLVVRSAPTSFNLRSLTRTTKDFSQAVTMLRLRASGGMSGHCTPSVSENGDVLVGETRFCYKVGTVDSSNEELTRNTLAMGVCNRCGLEENLAPKYRRAIGLTTLYGADE